MEEMLFMIGLGLPGLIILLLIFRKFNCWYWKINIAIDHLESIDKNLQFLVKQSTSATASEVESLPVQEPENALTDSELMERYDVTFKNGKYHYMSFSYDRLQDAVSYVKQSQQ